jgi:hypothetical protein
MKIILISFMLFYSSIIIGQNINISTFGEASKLLGLSKDSLIHYFKKPYILDPIGCGNKTMFFYDSLNNHMLFNYEFLIERDTCISIQFTYKVEESNLIYSMLEQYCTQIMEKKWLFIYDEKRLVLSAYKMPNYTSISVSKYH